MNTVKGIIISIAGAMLVFNILQMVLPPGNIKKYVSFVLGVFMLVVLISPFVGADRLDFSQDYTAVYPDRATTGELEETQRRQILKSYEQQLTDDFRKSIPALDGARFIFTFDIGEERFGEVQRLVIESPQPENASALEKLESLYGIGRDVVEWRKQGDG